MKSDSPTDGSMDRPTSGWMDVEDRWDVSRTDRSRDYGWLEGGD